MKRALFIPAAALVLLAACSDTATSPTSLTSVGGPLSAVVAAGAYTDPLADAQKGVQTANTPGGGHLQTGAIQCVVNAALAVTCSSYELGGVGNTNVDVHLEAVYSATVLCNNPAGSKNRNNDIEPHQTTFASSQDFNVASTKNGRLRIPQTSASPGGTDEDLCPNGNWETVLQDLVLESFTYSITFAGFSSPAVFISES
ncbi:MAG TPA: hypothetical protein VF163_20375 [Micromonosporaceae bacterium]